MATTQESCTLINGVNVDGLTATIEAVKTTPQIAKFKFNIRNKWKEAGQNSSTVAGIMAPARSNRDRRRSCWKRMNR